METLEKDLELAKLVMRVLTASVNGKLHEHYVSKRTNEFVAIYSKNGEIKYFFEPTYFNNVVKHHTIQIESSSNTLYHIEHDNPSEQIPLMNDPEDGAEYFQNSLLYTNDINESLLFVSYINKQIIDLDVNAVSLEFSNLTDLLNDYKELMRKE